MNLWIGSPRSITSWHRDHYENLYAMVSGHKTFRLLPPSDSYRMALRRYPLAVYCPTVLQSEEGTVDPAGIDDIIAGTAGMGLEGVKKVELTPRLAEPHQEVLWSSITPRSLKPAGGNGTESSIDEGIERALQGGDEEAGNVPPSLFDDPQLPAPLEVTIGPGEMLYLPACWWHEVHHGVASGGDGSGGIDAVEPIIAVNFWYEMSFDARYASTKAVEALAERLGLNDASPAL